VTAPEPARLSEEPIVQRIVNAWDCCGTCAGGVLAAHVREARAADAATIAREGGEG
jgi:hypothetical protein